MLNNIEIVEPKNIEKKSFEIITELMGERSFPKQHEPIIKRVIHTTADFEFADILKINTNSVESAVKAIRAGCNIVTDTKMAAAGINKKALSQYGGQVLCAIDDEEIAKEAKEKNITRSALCMDKLSDDFNNRIFVIGNAPTALIRLHELIERDKVMPAAVIGVPVGFVNVVEAKELFLNSEIPYIISEGRKGGSNIAAAIINAILYMIRDGIV